MCVLYDILDLAPKDANIIGNAYSYSKKSEKYMRIKKKMLSSGKNYLELQTFSPFNAKFMYFDKPDFVADQIFINEKLKVNFWKDGAKSGEKYVIGVVRVKRKNRKLFVSCMDKLRQKMLILDGTEYDEFCDRTMKVILAQQK